MTWAQMIYGLGVLVLALEAVALGRMGFEARQARERGGRRGDEEAIPAKPWWLTPMSIGLGLLLAANATNFGMHDPLGWLLFGVAAVGYLVVMAADWITRVGWRLPG